MFEYMVLLTQDCYRLLQDNLPFCLDFDDDNDDEGTLTGVDDRDDGSLSTSTRKGAHSHKTSTEIYSRAFWYTTFIWLQDGFSPPKQLKNLDLSYKTDLDFWVVLEVENILKLFWKEEKYQIHVAKQVQQIYIYTYLGSFWKGKYFPLKHK